MGCCLSKDDLENKTFNITFTNNQQIIYNNNVNNYNSDKKELFKIRNNNCKSPLDLDRTYLSENKTDISNNNDMLYLKTSEDAKESSTNKKPFKRIARNKTETKTFKPLDLNSKFRFMNNKHIRNLSAEKINPENNLSNLNNISRINKTGKTVMINPNSTNLIEDDDFLFEDDPVINENMTRKEKFEKMKSQHKLSKAKNSKIVNDLDKNKSEVENEASISHQLPISPRNRKANVYFKTISERSLGQNHFKNNISDTNNIIINDISNRNYQYNYQDSSINKDDNSPQKSKNIFGFRQDNPNPFTNFSNIHITNERLNSESILPMERKYQSTYNLDTSIDSFKNNIPPKQKDTVKTVFEGRINKIKRRTLMSPANLEISNLLLSNRIIGSTNFEMPQNKSIQVEEKNKKEEVLRSNKKIHSINYNHLSNDPDFSKNLFKYKHLFGDNAASKYNTESNHNKNNVSGNHKLLKNSFLRQRKNSIKEEDPNTSTK